ncbi:hypothetical protein ACOMHN_064568 [Nucella lapillus]
MPLYSLLASCLSGGRASRAGVGLSVRRPYITCQSWPFCQEAVHHVPELACLSGGRALRAKVACLSGGLAITCRSWPVCQEAVHRVPESACLSGGRASRAGVGLSVRRPCITCQSWPVCQGWCITCRSWPVCQEAVHHVPELACLSGGRASRARVGRLSGGRASRAGVGLSVRRPCITCRSWPVCQEAWRIMRQSWPVCQEAVHHVPELASFCHCSSWRSAPCLSWRVCVCCHDEGDDQCQLGKVIVL